MDLTQSNRPALLDRANALNTEEAGFAQFFKAAILATDGDDLERQAPEQFEATLRQSYLHLLAHAGNDSQVTATPPRRAGDPLVLDIVSPDMPFIVDSALAAVRAAGGTVRLFTHPVVRQANGRAMSVLHIHSDPVVDIEALGHEIETAMAEVIHAVRDWQPMLERLRLAIGDLGRVVGQRDEPLRFLDWLIEHNFTFLGMREYRLAGDRLEPLAESGLGILRDPDFKLLRSGATFVESTPQHRAFMESNEPLLVTKANVRARVHRRVHMDYVGIKLYAADG